MKYIVKILIIQMIALNIVIFQSCCKDEPYLRFNTLRVDTPRYFTRTYTDPDSTVSPAKFYITPFFNHESYASGISKIINVAYAVSPCETGQQGSKESVISISIISSGDVDSLHTAGKELSSLFRDNELDNRRSVFDATDSLNVIDANYFERLRLNYGARLWFIQRTVKDARHTFTIRIVLSDKREFTVSTEEIVFDQASVRL